MFIILQVNALLYVESLMKEYEI